MKRSYALNHNILNLASYTPIEPYEVLSQRLGLDVANIIKLDANENPYGPSPKAREALANLAFPHIYPDPDSRLLRAELSRFLSIPMENILADAGADELIDLILRVVTNAGDILLNCPPTFGMYRFDAQLNGLTILDIPRNQDFSLDIPAIRNAIINQGAKILFLPNPNNPDGSLTPHETLKEILDLPLLVVIDEAYIEFSNGWDPQSQDNSLAGWVLKQENLIVLRTFSKWAGLAGLRVGYGIFPEWLIPVLWKTKQPYNVSVAASMAAVASLQDAVSLYTNVCKVRRERERLFSELRNLSYLNPYPSQANFILCKVNNMNAKKIKDELAEQGIFIRYYNTPELSDMIRISVGKPEDTRLLVNALKEITPG